MKYILVEAPDPDQLSKTVQHLLDEGWELYGDPMFAGFATRPPVFAQALTNEQGEPEGAREEPVDRADLTPTMNKSLDELPPG